MTQTAPHSLAHSIKQRAHWAAHVVTRSICTKERIYYPALKAVGKHSDLCVQPSTDLVLEGYPRSSNTSTYRFLITNQSRPLKVAHHRHHAAQILRAHRLGIPAIALIRAPKQAVLSVRALSLEHVDRGGAPTRGYYETYLQLLTLWKVFYDALEGCLDDIILSDISMSTGAPEELFQIAEDRFGIDLIRKSDFEQPELSDLWHSKPSDRRNAIKAQTKSEFEEQMQTDIQLQDMLAACDALYHDLMARPGTLSRPT